MSSILSLSYEYGDAQSTLFFWRANGLNERLGEEEDESNEDEIFFLFLIQHILKLYKKSSYLFEEDIDCSEWDFVIKLWSPLIEELFINTDLRTKWGDTVCKLTHEDGTTDSKIDLRVLFDKMIQHYNIEHDVSAGEFFPSMTLDPKSTNLTGVRS